MQKDLADSSSQTSIPDSTPSTSQLTQPIESLHPYTSDQDSQTHARDGRQGEGTNSGRHPNLHNPHADEAEESNSSVLNAIFSPGLRSLLGQKFAAIANSFGSKSTDSLPEREGLTSSSSSLVGAPDAAGGHKSASNSNSQIAGSNALASSTDSISKIRLPSANGIHHAAYRKRPSNTTTPQSSVPPSPSHHSYADSLQHSQDASSSQPFAVTQQAGIAGLNANSSPASDVAAPSLVPIPETEEKLYAEEEEPLVEEVEEVENDENMEVAELIEPNEDDTQQLEYEEEMEEVPEGEEEGVEDEVSEEEFDAYLFMANVPPRESIEVPSIPPPGLPVKARGSPRVTLVLDLDETLVHCSLEKIDNPDLIFAVQFDEVEYQVYVRKRPGFEEFLSRVSELFEVAVFTASQKAYADKLLNILDPTKKWIHHRLFRESCVCVQGNYLKDLTILNRELPKVAIVDNSPYVFAYQIDNGVPIESWYNDTRDRELLHLLPFLETLINVPDVRPYIREKFQLAKRVEESLRSFQQGVANAQNQVFVPSALPAHLIPDYDIDMPSTPSSANGGADATVADATQPESEKNSGSQRGSHRSRRASTATTTESNTSSRSSRRTRGAAKTEENGDVSDAETPRTSALANASTSDDSSSNTKGSALPKLADDKSPSTNTSLIEGDDDDDKDERTVPAQASRRKGRVRSRLVYTQGEESDSDFEGANRASASRQSSTNSLGGSRRAQSKRS